MNPKSTAKTWTDCLSCDLFSMRTLNHCGQDGEEWLEVEDIGGAQKEMYTSPTIGDATTGTAHPTSGGFYE